MTDSLKQVDVLVVGAGSSGASAAYQLAREGLSVVLVEAKPLEEAGARWVVAVPHWMFSRAGIAPPKPPESIDADECVKVIHRSARRDIVLVPSPIVTLDTRRLIKRLQGLARKAGVRFLDKTRLVDLTLDQDQRPKRATLESCSPSGVAKRFEIEASLFVDASGLTRALLDRIPTLAQDCPVPRPGEVCSACQWVCEVTDAALARKTLSSWGAKVGQSLSWIGVTGGYSTIGMHVTEDTKLVGILTGIADSEVETTGLQLMEQFCSEHDWIGRVLWGGTGNIPIRRPYARLVDQGIALVGDVGCQGFPGHASGVGAGLVAGRMLAEAVKGQDDPGDLSALWRYQANFQRQIGSTNAAFELFSQMSQKIDGPDITTLFDSGLAIPAGARTLLEQRLNLFGLREGLDFLRGMLRQPTLTVQMLAWLVRMPVLYGLHKLYPGAPRPRVLKQWSRLVAHVLGAPPDIA